MTVQVQSDARPQRATLHHRKSVDKLTPDQVGHVRTAFARAMEVGDERGFSYFAGWHGEPFNWCEHGSPIFLPWHRAYLYYFELALRDLMPGVALPWWDWLQGGGLPAAYTEDPVGGQPNPLVPHAVRVYRTQSDQAAPQRAPGAAAQSVGPPYTQQWNYAMSATSFTEFQGRLEQLHNAVHVWVGGIMKDIQWAAYDPIFYAHHVMVDRAWRIWQYRHPGALPDRRLLDVALRPNGMKVRDTLDVKQLGYDYAGTTAHAAGTVG